MNSESISSRPQPHLQAISERLKFGVIMSAMNPPTTIKNVLLVCIRQPNHSFPSASSLVRISWTNLSSSDVDDFADANSTIISKTLNTTFSESIETTRVLVHPANSGPIIFSFQFIVRLS